MIQLHHIAVNESYPMNITPQQEVEAPQAPKQPDPMMMIGMRLKKDIVARIDACSKRELRSRSELVRIIFNMAFETYEKEQKPLAELMLAHNQ